MIKKFMKALVVLFFSFSMFGCSVHHYTVEKDRVDQELSSGNRGYAQDRAPQVDEDKRKKTRPHTMIEVEIGKPIKTIGLSGAVTSEEKVSEEIVTKTGKIK